MPLNTIFIVFIGIITLIRLGLIMVGPMDGAEKVKKMGNWIVGLVLVVIAWLILGKVFGVNTNGFKGQNTTEETKTGLDENNTKVNNSTYYGSGYEDQTQDIPVKIEPNNK